MDLFAVALNDFKSEEESYKSLIKKYLYDDTVTLDEILPDFLKNAFIIIITNIEGSWKNITMKKKDEYNFYLLDGAMVYTVHSKDISYKIEEIVKSASKEKNSLDFSDALVKTSKILQFLNDHASDLASFNGKSIKVNFTDDKYKFNKFIMDSMFSLRTKSKPTLTKLIRHINKILENDNNYKLTDEQIEKLWEKITSNNFTYDKKDNMNFHMEILDIFWKFKERGQDMSYLKKNNCISKLLKEKCFAMNIKSCIEQIKNYSSEESQDKLITFLKFRIEYILKIIPLNVLSWEEIQNEILLFIDSSIEYMDLEKKKITLIKEAEKIEEKMNKSINKKDEKNEKIYIKELKEIGKRINDCIKTYNYSKIRWNICLKLHIDQLLNSFLDSYDDGFTFNEYIILFLKAIVKSEPNESNISTYLSALNAMPKDYKIDKLPKKMLKMVPNSKLKIILSISKNKIITNSTDLQDYLYKILLTNDDDQVRNDVLECLKVYSKFFSEEMKENIILEELDFQDNRFIDLTKKSADYNRKLSIATFQKLAKCLNANKETIKNILSKIIFSDFQTIPKFFIENFKKANYNGELLEIGKLLIKGGYVEFNDIKMKEELYESNKKFLNELICLRKNLPEKAKKVTYSLLDLIDQNADLKYIRNPRNDLKEKQNKLKKIVKDGKVNLNYVILIFTDLIKYEIPLMEDTLMGLKTLIKNNNSIKIDKQIISSLKNSKIKMQHINTFISITAYTVPLENIFDLVLYKISINPEEKIEGLKILQKTIEKYETSEVSKQLEKLIGIAKKETDINVTSLILEILDEYTNNFQGQIKIQVNSLNKITSFKTIDQSILEEINSVLLKGYVITSKKIELLISNLNQVTLRDKLLETINNIYDLQNFSNVTAIIFLNAIISNIDLLNNSDMIEIGNLVYVRYSPFSEDFSNELMKQVWNYLKDALNDDLIPLLNDFACSIGKHTKLNQDNLSTIKDFVNKGNNFNAKIIGTEVLIKQNIFFKNYIQVLSLNFLNEYIKLVKMKCKEPEIVEKQLSKCKEDFEKFEFVNHLNRVLFYDSDFKISVLNMENQPAVIMQLLKIELISIMSWNCNGNINKLEIEILLQYIDSINNVEVLNNILDLAFYSKIQNKVIQDMLIIIYSYPNILKKKLDWSDFKELHKTWVKFNLESRDVKLEHNLEQIENRIFEYSLSTKSNILKLINSSHSIPHFLQFMENCSYLFNNKDFQIEIKYNESIYDSYIKLLKLYAESKNYLKNIDDERLRLNLLTTLSCLLFNGWNPDFLDSVFSVAKPETIHYLNECLMIIYNYNLREYDRNKDGQLLIDILSNLVPSPEAVSEIHMLAIFTAFPGTYEKNKKQLSDELKEKNNNVPYLNDNIMLNDYEHVMKAYHNISMWNNTDILNWSKNKTHKGCSNFVRLAVVIRAVEITLHFSPRIVLVMSVLCALKTNNAGRLFQVNTGEGKTTAIAMLAIMKCFEGHKVDVITSSSELAKPQSEEMRDLYNKFDISVSYNNDDSLIKKPKDCYLADIVYGTASEFQGDILRDEFSKMKTMNGRKSDVAIVDEVDNMLIDGKDYIVMLSSQMPAMNHLEPILATICIQIDLVRLQLQEIDGKWYYIENVNDEKTNEFTTNQNNIVQEKYLLEEPPLTFIKRCTETYIKEVLRDLSHLSEDERNKEKKRFPSICIPIHLKDFVNKVQLSNWIDNAIYAKYGCNENRDYVIENGKVKPVDAVNTGIIQQNMVWNNGLHQFIQMKHGLPITPESVTTNYLSNVSFFKRYKNEIFGLTGTLGSEKAKVFLENTYTVDSIIVPPYKEKQHVQLMPIITATRLDWIKAVAESTLSNIKQHRAALIITKYIQDVEEISTYFTETLKYNAKKIKKYRSSDDSGVVLDQLRSSEVIIATNIAGRGTNIKPCKIVNDYGGLHVCLTFLPPNERTENQNIGRTSRTGYRGSSQFVLLEESSKTLLELKLQRNKDEEHYLDNAKKETQLIIEKDLIFKRFCTLLDDGDSIESIIFQDSIKERFGLWLKENEGKEDLDNLYRNEFERKIKLDKTNDELIKNPYFHIQIGNIYLENEHKNEKAFACYNKAIKMDPDFSETSFYCRAYCRLAWKGKEGIDDSIKDFEKSRENVNNRIQELHIVQYASTPSSELQKSKGLSDQVLRKMKLYDALMKYIDYAIGRDSKIIEEEIAEAKKNGNKLSDKEVNTRISELQKEMKEGGKLNQAKRESKDINISLIDIKGNFPEEEYDTLKEELIEFKINGFIGGFNIELIEPIPWGNVIALLLIGLGQCVIGAAIMVFSAGSAATIGAGLIAEGISDMITAVEDGIINRNFSWKYWGIQKAISLTLSIAFAGMGAIKGVAKMAFNVVKSVGKPMVLLTKQGFKLMGQTVAKGFVKGVVTHVVVRAANYIIDKTCILQIKNKIRTEISDKISRSIKSNSNINFLLCNDRLQWVKDVINNIINVFSDLEFVVQTICQELSQHSKVFAIGYLLHSITKILQYADDVLRQIYEKVKAEVTRIKKESKGSNLNVATDNEIRLKTNQNELIDFTIEEISERIVDKVRTDFIQPVTHFAVGSTTRRKLDKALYSNKLELFKSERKIHHLNRSESNHVHKYPLNSIDIVKADQLIKDFKNDGKAGIYHLQAVNSQLDRPLYIYNNKKQLIFKGGEGKKGRPIKVVYHKDEHYTLLNNIDAAKSGKNNCLFDTISSQINEDPKLLRKRALDHLESNQHELALQIHHIELLNNFKKSALLIGGARFIPGTSDQVVKVSDKKAPEGVKTPGHLLKHVDGDDALKYAKKNKKPISSVFTDKATLLRAMEFALDSLEAHNKMAILNDETANEADRLKQTITIDISNETGLAITGFKYEKGEKIDTELTATHIVVVMGHQKGKLDQADADVHIRTMYPVFPN